MANVIMDLYTPNPEWNDDSIPSGNNFRKFNSGINTNKSNAERFPALFNADGSIIESRWPKLPLVKSEIDAFFATHRALLKKEFDVDDTLDNYLSETDRDSLHYKMGNLRNQARIQQTEAETLDPPRKELVKSKSRILSVMNQLRYYFAEQSFKDTYTYTCKTGDSDFSHIFRDFILEATLTIQRDTGNKYTFDCNITKTVENYRQYDGVETTFVTLPFYMPLSLFGLDADIISHSGVYWVLGRNCDIRPNGEIFIATLPTDTFTSVRIAGKFRMDMNTVLPETLSDLYQWNYI